jgi:hypothetical protein
MPLTVKGAVLLKRLNTRLNLSSLLTKLREIYQFYLFKKATCCHKHKRKIMQDEIMILDGIIIILSLEYHNAN